MPDGPTAGVRGLLASRQALGVCAVAGAMFTAAVLGLAGLGNHPFWDDEANTAIYARNLLTFHRLTAWDGRNLVGYAYGGALGEDLGRELRVPPLPAYVAALGVYAFGPTTFGGRIMFVVAGVVSIGLLAVWLRRHFSRRFPWWLPSLVLALSPAYLLYIRNCRYYALGVMFTLLVWIFWAPGRSRGRLRRGSLLDRRSLLRYTGGATAMLLLLGTHYLNAAAVLVTLPLFFLDRRYRQPRQYVLLGIIYAAAVGYGGWLWATVNPFAAQYQVVEDWLFPTAHQPDWWTHFYTHLCWLLRDLGTHEFFPWCLVVVFLVPWLSARFRRLRGLAWRGLILVAVVLVYVLLAALLTPADMAKGPWAEMRYVVPLIALGTTVGSLALVILWRLARPLAPVAFVLLVTTNLLHLGFLSERRDGTSAYWPPTLYRYVHELFHDYQTGNEEMLALLEQLPEGTTVRTWPTYMTHPAIFYVPKLHYCDQLTKSKKIRPDLRHQLPPYLFKESAQPDVVLVPEPRVGEAWEVLQLWFGPDSYQLNNALSAYYDYTWKPEIPAHFFSSPPSDWARFPGMVVLVKSSSPVADHPALASDVADADAAYRLGLTWKTAGNAEIALSYFTEAVRMNRNHSAAHYNLAELVAAEGEIDLGIKHYRAALKIRPDWASAHYNLANLLEERGKIDEAVYHFQAALEYDPTHAKAHVNLGSILCDRGLLDEAIAHYRQALQIDPRLVEAYLNLGLALDARGEKQAAVAEIRKALQFVPPDSPPADRIHELLKRVEDGE